MLDLTDGFLCLDFTNTVEDRPNETPQELLHTYSDLLAWGPKNTLLISTGEDRIG